MAFTFGMTVELGMPAYNADARFDDRDIEKHQRRIISKAKQVISIQLTSSLLLSPVF